VKAARSARANELLDEMIVEMRRLTDLVNTNTARILAENEALERRAELLRWKTAELAELSARAERGELGKEEALEALIRYGLANDAEGLAD
jgi:predicted transcriptional regulator